MSFIDYDPTPARPSSPACATWLTTSPATPPSLVPVIGTEILLHAASTDDGGCAQVDRFARQLGVPVENEPGLLRPLPGCPVLRPGRLPDGRHLRCARWPATTRTTPTTATSPPTPGPDA